VWKEERGANAVGFNSTQPFANWPQEWVTARGLSAQRHSSPCLTTNSLQKRTFLTSEKSVVTPSQMLPETAIVPVPETVKTKVSYCLFKDCLSQGTEKNKKKNALNHTDLVNNIQTETPSPTLCLIPHCFTCLFIHCLYISTIKLNV